MGYVIAAIFLGLSVFASKWFLLGLATVAMYKLPMLWRRARLIAALKIKYQYEFPPLSPHAYMVNKIERDTRNQKLNDYERATLFMTGIVNSLQSDSEDGRTFANKIRDNAFRLRYVENEISDEIFWQLDHVVEKHLTRA